MRWYQALAGRWQCRHHCMLTLTFSRSLSPVYRRPVFLTLCHMMACATLGYLLSLGKCTPIKPLKNKKQMWKVCLLACIFCLTIVLGNLSLKYIPVSFNQAIGATTPFFTAIFALLLQGESAWPLGGSVLHPLCATYQHTSSSSSGHPDIGAVVGEAEHLLVCRQGHVQYKVLAFVDGLHCRRCARKRAHLLYTGAHSWRCRDRQWRRAAVQPAGLHGMHNCNVLQGPQVGSTGEGPDMPRKVPLQHALHGVCCVGASCKDRKE